MLLHLVSWWITQPFPSPGWVCWTFTFAFRSDQFNGQLAFLCHAIAALFALNYFRRKYFEVFFYTHTLYLGVFAFGIYHTWGVQQMYGWKEIVSLGDDYFIYYLAIPLSMFFIDRMIRFYDSNFVPTRVISAQVENGAKLTKLVLQRKNFTFESGQYCFINIPQLSSLQWHPFSISSSPESPQTFSFHIKSMGRKTWTDQLFQLVKQNPNNLVVKVDGPFGAKSLKPEQYQVCVLYCGGVGATPMISILSDMIDRHKFFAQKTRKVYFHWVIREAENMAWFSDLWERIFKDENKEVVKIGEIEFEFCFHLTQSKDATMKQIQTPDSKGKMDNEALPLMDSKRSFKSLESYVPSACYSMGRPKSSDILKKIRDNHVADEVDKIALFACGPKEMTDELARHSFNLSTPLLKIDFHQETFFL